MLPADRKLLAKVATLNQSLGELVTRLLATMDTDAPIPANALRQLGQNVEQLADALLRRAEEVDGGLDEPGRPSRLDAR